MKIKEYLYENSCDLGGINLGRIKWDAWEKIKDIEIDLEDKESIKNQLKEKK